MKKWHWYTPSFHEPLVISAKSPVYAVHNRKPYQQDREILVHFFLDREQGMARREHWGKCCSASLSESEGERREQAGIKVLN